MDIYQTYQTNRKRQRGDSPNRVQPRRPTSYQLQSTHQPRHHQIGLNVPAVRDDAARRGSAWSVWSTILCWSLLFVVLFGLTGIVVALVINRNGGSELHAANSPVPTHATPEAEVSDTPPDATLQVATNVTEPCDDFYHHVCSAHGSQSAFRQATIRNRGIRDQYIQQLPTYCECIKDDGQLHRGVPGVSDSAMQWQAFTSHQWQTGGAVPISVRVEKAIDRSVHVLLVEPDFTLAHYLYDTHPAVAAAIFPVALMEPIWQWQETQTLDMYVDQYKTWGEIRDMHPTSELTGALDHGLDGLLMADTLVHAVMDVAHERWYTHVLTLCTDGLGTLGEDECAMVQAALRRATDELQPGLDGYQAHIVHHRASNSDTPGTLAWYRHVQHSASGTPRRTSTMRAHGAVLARAMDTNVQDASDAAPLCYSITAALHRGEVNSHIANTLYTSRQQDALYDEVHALGDHLRSALSLMIHRADWLHYDTRTAALAKLEHLKINIMATSPSSETSKTTVTSASDPVTSSAPSWQVRLQEFRTQQIRDNLALLHSDYRPPDMDTNWREIDVAVVNAWYQPRLNSITIPVGILQPPFYTPPDIYRGDGVEDVTDDKEVEHTVNETGETATEEERRYWHNLATIGLVLGHEMGHALDTSGRFFDARGDWSVDGWWALEDQVGRSGFAARTTCLANDFGHPCDREDYGLHTIGEDIADQLGVRAAYHVQEFTQREDMQMFYRNYATLWCAQQTHIQECALVASDVHALPRHRVNKSVRQLETFRRAFGCSSGDAMVNDTPCLVY